MLNMAAIRTREADFPGDYDDFMDEIQDEIESEIDTEEIDLEQVTDLALTADDQYYDDTMLLLGNFAYDDIRDDWEDQGFEEDS